MGGGSLPPISKSTLPPLSRTLPVLKKEVSKEEKMPVNPLDMSTLPKISREEQGKYTVHGSLFCCTWFYDMAQQSPWGQRKVAYLEKWPSWGEGVEFDPRIVD